MNVSAAHMEEEDPTIVCRKLHEMEIEIDSIKSKSAYDEAERPCPVYLEKLKVIYLRGNLFDARKAARNLIKHWEVKLELFRCDRTFSGSIKQSDMDDADMECLITGGLQIVPEKDRGGRTIFWQRREHIRYREKENYLRTVWYLIMSQLESDEDSQKNGWVCVAYNVGQFRLEYFNLELYTKLWKIVKLLPGRIVGYHACFNDLKLRSITPFTLLFMGKEARARYRCHFGSHAECLFEIMTYGIPLHILPVSLDGHFDSSHHLDWMERMQEIESSSFEE